MTDRVALDAEWRVAQHEPGLAFGWGTSTYLTPIEQRWVPATVPGDVHLDYLRAGIIDDPFVGRNGDHCRWMAENDWWYESAIVAPPHEAGQRVFLDFEGINTFASVYLDGELIGEHANAFRPLRIDVTDRVGTDSHQLRVRVASPMSPPGRDLGDPSVVAYGPRRRPHSRAPQLSAFHTFAWIETIGIWRPVSWIVANTLEFDDVHVRTVRLLDDGTAELEALVEVTRHGGALAPIRLDLSVAGETRHIDLDIGWDGAIHRETFLVQDPELWWPHNHGAQPRYEYRARISRGGTQLDATSGRFGIRTIRLAQEPDSDGGTSFRLEVNGKPIFLKGMNWVPLDSLFARVPTERYHEMLSAAKTANVNAIRVNGCGLYESEDFYDFCDENGILVTQDFAFADAAYPQDAPFLEECRKEAEYQVRRLRHHPSLAWWCGDNENDQVVDRDLGHPEYVHNALNKKVLPAAVRTHAPGTPYVYSSPSSPSDRDQNLVTQGTCHLWRFGIRWDDVEYTSLRPRMVIEIGMFSMPNRDVVERMLGEGVDRWPVYNDTYFAHLDDSRNSREAWYDILFDTIRAAGLEEPKDLDDLIAKSQWVQTEATRFWIEYYGAQETCWGVFLWALNDTWPAPSCAYISYPFEPKPAFAAAAAAFGAIDR